MPFVVESVAIAKNLETINSPHSIATIVPKIENDFPGLPLLEMPIRNRTKPPSAERIPSPSRPVILRVIPRKSLVMVAQGIAAPTINRSPPIMVSFFGFISDYPASLDAPMSNEPVSLTQVYYRVGYYLTKHTPKSRNRADFY
jgi:hypothetical protein